MSPELFQNKPYNHKSDTWALGTVRNALGRPLPRLRTQRAAQSDSFGVSRFAAMRIDSYCLFVCATVKLAASTVADGVKCCAGCVLFEMMTKRHPFEAQDINALMKKVQTGPVKPCLALPFDRPEMHPERRALRDGCGPTVAYLALAVGLVTVRCRSSKERSGQCRRWVPGWVGSRGSCD